MVRRIVGQGLFPLRNEVEIRLVHLDCTWVPYHSTWYRPWTGRGRDNLVDARLAAAAAAAAAAARLAAARLDTKASFVL